MSTSVKGTVAANRLSSASAGRLLLVMAWIGLAGAASAAFASSHNRTAVACGVVAVAPAVWYLLEHLRPATVFTVLCVTAWLPLVVPLTEMWVFEFAVWTILALQVTRLSASGFSARETLRGVPLTGFGLLIAGAFIGWAVGGAVTDELATIRLVCVLPLAILLLGRLCISRREDAVRILIVWVITDAVLALVFSFGVGRVPGVTLATYGADSGRQAITILLPTALGTGRLDVLQAPAGVQFGYILPFAFALWALARQRWVRIAGFTACVAFLWAIVFAQGRGGGLTGLAGVLFFTAAATLLKRETRRGIVSKGVGLVAVATCGAWVWALQSSHSQQLTHRLLALVQPSTDVNLPGRMSLIGAALRTLRESWFYGISLQGDVAGFGIHVHYSVLTFFLAFGVVGFAGVVALTVSLCVTMAKALVRDRSSEALMVLLPAIWGVFSLALNHVWWDLWTVPLTWIPVAAALGLGACSRSAGRR